MKKFIIYKHTSPIGKIYIGQTSQNNPIKRWKNGGKGYFSIDKFGNYHQKLIAEAINKYPWKDWKHEIIDTCNTLEEANKLETYYIKLYKSNNPEFGYNMTSGGQGHLGHPMSQETKNKLSKIIKDKYKNDKQYVERVRKAHLGIPMHENTRKALLEANIGREFSDETKLKIGKANGKIVLQFDLNGKFLKEYYSASEAARDINMTSASITNQCNNITRKCDKYLFLYKEDFEKNPNLIKEKVEQLKVQLTEKGTLKHQGKPIIQLSKTGEFIMEFNSTKEASEKLNISITSINNCLCGRSKSAGKFKWIYKT